MPFQLPDPYDVNTGDTMTARGIPSAPPMPTLPPVPPPTPTFNPQAGAPPPPPMPPSAAPVAPPQDNELANYLAQQKAGLSKYGPEQQMAVEQDILKQRTGLGSNLANAGAGFADAIMQGVARAGPSNFQSNLQARTDKTQEGMRSAMEKAQTGKMAQMQEEMKLSGTDPSSLLSRMAQKAYGPSLKTMPGGQSLTDAQIAAIPASLMADIASKKIDLTKALAEIENTQAFREASIGMQHATLANTAAHERTEEGIAKAGKQQEAAKVLAAQGPIKRFSSWITQNPAQKVLQQQAVGGPEANFTPDVLSYAQTHNITPAQAQAVKDKRTGGQ